MVSFQWLSHTAVAAFLPWLPCQAPMQRQSASCIDKELSSFVQNLMTEWDIPGVSLAVVRRSEHGLNDWSVETTGWGVRNAKGDPVDGDTLMSIGSNSKLFAAFATGLLAANESTPFNWESKVHDVIPEWQLQDPFATNMTDFVDLLTHRTGVPRHELSYGRSDHPLQVIKNLRNLKPSSEFRHAWQYNNMMYTTASYLPELFVNMSYTDYVQNHILDPLRMTSTFYDVKKARETGRLADGFYCDELDMTGCYEKMVPKLTNATEGQNVEIDPRCLGKQAAVGWWLQPGEEAGIAGAGGVISSANDLAKWLQMLLTTGKAPHNNTLEVIPPSLIEACTAGISVVTPLPKYPENSMTTYGMAQMRYSYRGHDVIEHGGAVTGFKSQVMRMPGLDLGIAIMVNSEQYATSFFDIIKFRIIDRVLGLDPIDWNLRHKKTHFGNYSDVPAEAPRLPKLPSRGLRSLAGVYHDEGYGQIHLCVAEAAEIAETAYCSELLRSLPASIFTSRPSLITEVDAIWAKYILLEHFDKDTFNVTLIALAETGLVMDSRDTAKRGGTAVFGDGGLGLFDAWGAGDGVPNGNSSKGLREGAEIFFDKV